MERLRGVQDPYELIRSNDIDAISLCSPTPTHAELMLAAIRAGKHVLCEKPFCRTTRQAEEVREATRAGRVVVMPAMVVRFMPAYEWLAAAVADGRYGRVRAARFSRLGPPPTGWAVDGRASGGGLLDLHLHDTDFVCAVFGVPQAVSSRGFRGRTGAIDHVHTLYHCASGPDVVTAEGSWAMRGGFRFRARFTVLFEEATADSDMARESPMTIYAGGRGEPLHETGTGHEREIRHFVECVREGRPPRVTPDDAVTGLRVIDATRESVERGETVMLEPAAPPSRVAGTPVARRS